MDKQANKQINKQQQGDTHTQTLSTNVQKSIAILFNRQTESVQLNHLPPG